MLIRLISKNVYSFKDEIEFNLFPNKTQRLAHHKVQKDNISFLRLSAIYGANGSGKSNLIKSISLLKSMISNGKIIDNKEIEDVKFKLNDNNKNIPISFGVEFVSGLKIFYYSITFDKDLILNECLYESKKDSDIVIFERNYENEKQSIVFHKNYTFQNEKNKLFVEILEEKLVQKDELLISFLESKYKDDFKDVSLAFDWFERKLIIINPTTKPGGLAHILDTNLSLFNFSNALLPSLNTGINSINVKKEKFDDFLLKIENSDLKNIKDDLIKAPDELSILTNAQTGEEATVVREKDEILIKRLVANHLNNKGKNVEFQISMESDGTRRLIDYFPALSDIYNQENVYLIDEIERSIHPLTIKEIITKISLDESVKGQLIFTTHESCLLDQEILRPDEIWFAQKDIDGSSRMYSLSDFNIHSTANIENGYLNGRYGGIPFLSNLKDLNWNKYGISD